MPKLKTNSGARKRFRVSKTKKFKYTRSGRRHILETKSPGKSRKMRKSAYIHKADERRVRQLMPYA